MKIKADFQSEKSTYLPDSLDQQEISARFTEIIQGGNVSAVLRDANGNDTPLPDELFEILQQAAVALQEGRGVTIVPTDAQLTTQEAADFLGVSRPTLVKLLEANEIPYELVGRHRRVLLRDLKAYEGDAAARRAAALREITESTREVETFYRPGDVRRTGG